MNSLETFLVTLVVILPATTCGNEYKMGKSMMMFVFSLDYGRHLVAKPERLLVQTVLFNWQP